MQFTMYQWELPSEEITLFENTASGAILPLNQLVHVESDSGVLLIGKKK